MNIAHSIRKSLRLQESFDASELERLYGGPHEKYDLARKILTDHGYHCVHERTHSVYEPQCVTSPGAIFRRESTNPKITVHGAASSEVRGTNYQVLISPDTLEWRHFSNTPKVIGNLEAKHKGGVAGLLALDYHLSNFHERYH